jgi:hypothetical protein
MFFFKGINIVAIRGRVFKTFGSRDQRIPGSESWSWSCRAVASGGQGFSCRFWPKKSQRWCVFSVKTTVQSTLVTFFQCFVLVYRFIYL